MIIPENETLKCEEWRVIESASAYEVSSLGRVKRTGGGVRGAKVGRILRGVFDKDGYIQVQLSIKNKVTPRKVHHLVLLAFVGPRPTAKHGGAHEDNNRENNCAGNLSWKTQKDNIHDKKRHGTHGMVLIESEVHDIRFRRKLGYTYDELAALFDTGRSNIASIVKGRTWRHLYDCPRV